jgi:uncharacterized membrane protein YbaN (DUF454 family)
VALLVAMEVSVVAAIVFGFIAGHVTPLTAAASVICGVGSGIYTLTTVGLSGEPTRKPRVLDWFIIVCFGLFTLRSFCWVLFVDGEDLSILSENNFSDMPLHLTFINYLARGPSFWPDNPIYSGLKLHYPIGTDLFNALLKMMGLNEILALIAVGLAASLITCVALYQWGKGFAVAGFLFSGGTAGFSFFSDLWDSFREFLHTGHFVFSICDYQFYEAWKNIALAMFVTQRGLLYAIPAGLFLLCSWRDRWLRNKTSALPLPIEAVFFSTLPLFNVHAFIWFSALLGYWLAVGPPGIRLHVAKLVGVSFIPATIFVALVTGLFCPGGSMAHVIHLQPGWLQADDGFVEFWFGNFGVLPLCTAALLLLLFWKIEFRRASPEGKRWHLAKLRFRFIKRDWRENEVRTAPAFTIPAIALFLLACIVMFAPWEWDNTKMMVWSYFVVLPFLWQYVVKPLPRLAGAALCILLFFSGFVSLWGGIDRSHTGWPIVNRQEMHDIRIAIRDLPVNETFAAYPDLNHPLLLSGCKLAEGFEGHLHSHGIDYRPRLRQLDALLSGRADWGQIADELHIRYLFWGGLEQEHYPQSLAPWRQQCPVIAHGAWGTIYDLKPQPTSVSSR